jgi:hypothetical protein
MQVNRKGFVMLRVLLSSALLLCVSAASAQTIVINPDKNRVQPAAIAEPVRVSFSINTFFPAAEDDGAQALKAQEDGRKMIYEAASHECDLLRATIASDCRLESININVQRVSPNQYGQRAGYNVNGSMNYRIGVK